MTQRSILPSRINATVPTLARGLKHTMQTRIARDRAREALESEELSRFCELLKGGG